MISALQAIWIALSAAATSQCAYALPIHETIYSRVAPKPDDIADWSKLPGKRTFLIRMEDPFPDELAELANLQGADRLRIESSIYPADDTEQEWTTLAQQGAEFIAIDAGFHST